MECTQRKYNHFLEIFLSILHPKHCYFISPYFPGSWSEQPAITTQILTLLKVEYAEYLRELMKAP